MTRMQLTTGVAVTAGLAVVALFFVFMQPAATQAPTEPSTVQPNSAQLVVQDETVGTGDVAAVGDTITVDYTGKLQDGSVFDTSIGRTPFPFVLGAGQVIQGWDQGLQGMKVGGKRLLIVPPSLGYGAQAVGPIPANSMLVFEVNLLSVQPSGSATPSLEGPAAN